MRTSPRYRRVSRSSNPCGSASCGSSYSPGISYSSIILCGAGEFCSPAVSLGLSVQLTVYRCYLLHPGSSLPVLQLQYLLIGPVEIVGYIGYLFSELVERVARYSPDGTSSTSNTWLQLG